jgi:hypothetical protein
VTRRESVEARVRAREWATPRHARRALLLAALVPWLAQCAAVERSAAPVPVAAVSARGWRASPELQRLVDPSPEVIGPSWLGADVATSVRLTDDHYIWLFGDTLLGSVETDCPDGASYCDRRADDDGFIANSVGVMTRDLDGSFFPLVKYWRTVDGAPAPVLAAADPDEFLWPLAGLVVGTRLLVTTTRQTRAAGLASHGNVLVVVENPEDPAYDWRSTRYDVPNVVPSAGNGGEDAGMSWATALVARGDHVYLFGSRGGATEARTILARLRVADLLARELRFRPSYLLETDDGALVWSETFDGSRLHEIPGLPGTSEATVDRDPHSGRWSSFQIPPLAFEVREYTAERLIGPWRDEGPVYSIPPPWSAERPGGETPFAAYAAKSHPELVPPSAGALSYNVNVAFGTLEEAIEALETIEGFYVPQMVERAAD